MNAEPGDEKESVDEEAPARNRAVAGRDTRSGFAMPVAIFGLVVVGVMVTGGFFLAHQESQIGVANRNATRALYLAEEGMNDVLLDWVGGGYPAMAPWTSTTVTGTGDGGTWTTEVLKTSERSYMLSTTATVTEGGAMVAGATREIGGLYRVVIPQIIPPAAITTQGAMGVSGTSQIQGNDDTPTGWGGSCWGATENKPGIMIDDADNVTIGGGATVDGDPPIQEDSTITTTSLLDFGDFTWSDLVSMATKTYADGVTVTNTEPDSVDTGSGYSCDTGLQSNWGDPLNPGATCFDYFPTIYAEGNLTINSTSKGQGILLVEGDFLIEGGYEFYGIVIVRGTFETAGTGGHVNGGVIAANANLDTSTASGDAVVTNSTCAAKRAVYNNIAFARPKPLSVRNWIDKTALSY